MQYITIAELIYASYTDIISFETEPVFLLFCMAGRILEMIFRKQRMTETLIVTVIVFLALLTGCLLFSMGGADALVGALICLNIGTFGVYACMTGFLLAIPYMAWKKGREIPLIPFFSAGYLIWLAIYM